MEKQLKPGVEREIKEEPYRNKFNPNDESDSEEGKPHGGQNFGEVSPSTWAPEQPRKKVRHPVPNTNTHTSRTPH